MDGRSEAWKRLRTPICERLGIEFPVFQAGMGWVARGELAAAVLARLAAIPQAL